MLLLSSSKHNNHLHYLKQDVFIVDHHGGFSEQESKKKFNIRINETFRLNKLPFKIVPPSDTNILEIQ